MKKAECEKAVRSLCHDWRDTCGFMTTPMDKLNSYSFLSWLRENHPHWLKFRTTTSVEDDVELWFDQEFKQMWRR